MTGGARRARRPRAARARALLTAAMLTAAALTAAGCRVVIAAPAAPASSPASPATGAPSAAAPAGGAAGLAAVHDPRQVTGALSGRCRYRYQGGAQLPDPRCTPGSIDPAVTQANIRETICVSGYTKTVRPPESQTERFKYGVAYPAYGTPRSKKTELDHLVSLELGGSNDAANLWPESPPVPNPKDKIENALHRAVCDGRVTLGAAQRAIATDWVTAESVLGLG